MAKKEYRFNPDTLSYEEIKEPLRLRVYRVLRKGLVVFIAVCIVNIVYSSLYYTPKLRRIAREEEEYLMKYRILDNRIKVAGGKLAEIKDRDNNVYRRIFAADTLAIEGIYNPYPQDRYIYMSDDYYGSLMMNSWRELDAVSRLLYLQSRSLDELQMLAMAKENLATAVPAIWPIDRRNLRKIDRYGGRIHPIYKRWIFHKGIDLGAHTGDPVYATASGVVKSTDKGQRRVGYGQQVLIDHGFGYQTRYAHLSKIEVKPGQVVRKGEQIGLVGSTGGSTGPHLHYEVIYKSQTVNPINYLQNDMDEAEFEKIIATGNAATFETEFQ